MSSGLIPSQNNSKKQNNRGTKEDPTFNANSSFERQHSQNAPLDNAVNVFERNEQEEQNQVADIISQILNQRKPQVTDSHFQNMNVLNDEEGNVRHNLTNLAYQIKNKDSNGRAILHRAAMDHKPADIKQILREYTKRPGRLDVNQPDEYGNTALILSCVFNPKDEQQREDQKSVVEQLIDFSIKQTEEKEDHNNSFSHSGTFRVQKVPTKNIMKRLTPLDAKTQNQIEEKKRQEILNQRYQHSVKINARNHQTQFTALHWACINGRYEIVDLLLQNGAKQFIPDADGFFPIDYAGIFSHENIVQLLIDQHLRELENSKRDYDNIILAPPLFGSTVKEVETEWMHYKDGAKIATDKFKQVVPEEQKEKIILDRKIDFWKFYRLGQKRYGSELGEEAPMMFSPIFATRLLYWGIINDLDEATFRQLLTDNDMIETYPEAPVMGIGPHYRRSPIHAAAMKGSKDQLDMMLLDVRRRYQTEWDDIPADQQLLQKANRLQNALKNKVANMVDTEQGADPRPTLVKHNIYPFAEGQKWQWHMGMGNSRDNKMYIAKLEEYRAAANQDWEYKWKSTKNNYSQNQMFTFDFLDSHNNTPLHLASQKMNLECIEFLTLKTSTYKMRDDLRNLSGHTPADILRQNSYQKQKYFKALTQFDDENKLLESQKSMIVKKNQLQLQSQPAPVNTLRPYGYMQNQRDKTINELRRERRLLPSAPRLIMKVDVRADNPKKANIVNSMLQTLKLSKFQIQMVQSVDLDIFYVGLDMKKEDLESEAQAMKIKIKVFDIDTKQNFSTNFRNEFEPFRTKDIQTVLWRKLQRQINITQYQNQGVIQEVFPMHDMHEIHEMKKIWYRANKTGSLSFAGLNFNLILMPIPLIRSFFIEGGEFRYTELAAIKNYFGEKVGFQYAWMSFYTVWLTLPTIVGIALSIYQMVKGVDTPLTTMYALFVCVWVTVFIERWKRKAAEICLRWGLSNMVFNTLENRIQRDEFHGYEAFNHDSHQTEIKTLRTFWIWISLILQIPLYIILIALCIGSFILQEWIKAKGLSLQTKTQQSFTNTTIFSSNISLGNVTYNNFSIPINQNLPIIPISNSSIFDNSSLPGINFTNQIIGDGNNISILTNLTNSTLRFLAANVTTATTNSGLSLLENPGTVNILVGFVNAIFIEIFDFIYSYAATYYVNLENHKFLDSFEKSFVFKMFIFKFINTNISIFYTAFIADRNDKNKFDNLYYLLLGMAGTKSVKIFILKNLKKIATVWAYKRWYFRKVFREAVKQIQSQMCYRQDNQIIHQKEDLLSDRSARRAIKNSDSKSIIPSTSDKLQRSIFNTDLSKNQERVLIDYIEMNSLMIESSELIYINERTDVFVIFGLATLYCCACPVVPLIAMIHNMIDMNMDLYVCYTSTKRPLQKTMTNIGPWLAIAEFMAFAAVVSNCLLLYFSTNSLREWLKTTQIGLGPTTGQNDIYLLFLIIGVEHCIVLIKQLVAELVPDVPPWVEKAQHRIERQEEEMAKREEEEEVEKKQKIANEALAKIKEMSYRRVQIMEQIQQEIGRLKQTVGEKSGEIVALKEEKAKMQEELRVANALSQKAVKEAEQKLQKKFGLSDFLQINQNEWLAKERGLQLDIALNKNLQKRLFIQSYNQLEKEILSRRLGKLFDTKQTSNSAIHLLTGGLQINCAQCLQAMATIECVDCVDHFCKNCCDQIHNSELDICKDHRFIDLNFQVGSEKPKVMRWKKFEYFNFPLVEQNALYQQIQLLYNFFKTFFFNQNYVEQDKQLLSLKSFFLDRNYHLMTDIQGQIQMNQDEQMFGKLITEKPKDQGIKAMIQAKSQFNEEELFYLNLIANYLLQNDSLTFENFIKTLGTLQGGTLVKRIQLWFKLINATQITRHVPTKETLPDDELLTDSRKNLEDAFRFSFVQLRPLSPSIVKAGQPKDYKQIIDMIFSDDKQTDKEYQTITLKRFMEVVNSNEDINEFMCAVLQFRGVSNFVIPSGSASQSVITTISSQ